MTSCDKRLKRRDFLRKSAVGAALAAGAGAFPVPALPGSPSPNEELNVARPATGSSGGKRPNVVVLLADDLGFQDIGCYGGPAKTPAIDGLAANGVRFADFHSGCAVCSPSRATLLTGRNHIRAGVYHVLQDSAHNAHLLEREVTLAEILKNSGYATAHLGKWHLGLPTKGRDKPTPDKHGFDYWFATGSNANPRQENPANFIRNGTPVGRIEGYSCQIVVNEAIAWLNSRPKPNEPFFLNIWFHEPHAPIAAPAEIVSRYGKVDDPAAIYSGTIENTDRAIARLLASLKEMGVLENTLIIYSPDNGSYREDRNGGLRGSKGSNFEGGIRSPGVFCRPGGSAGSNCMIWPPIPGRRQTFLPDIPTLWPSSRSSCWRSTPALWLTRRTGFRRGPILPPRPSRIRQARSYWPGSIATTCPTGMTPGSVRNTWLPT